MALYPVTTGNTVLAADLNQLIGVLQRSSGTTETGKYYNAGWSSAVNDKVVCYIPSLSRNSVPVSVTIDTVDTPPTGVNSPTTSHLTANGFAVEASATGSGVNIGVGGNYTILY